MFKKTCYACGAKVDKLYDGICLACFKEQHKPIEEIKPVKFKICNFTKQISYKNMYYDEEEIKEMLPDIVKKNIVINPFYKLEKIDIENFEVDGHMLRFEVIAHCDLEE